jgi:predicted TIM-barrel fold metal-dependent hydrolase
MGHMPTSAGLDNPGFEALVGLVHDGHWVKLSGAFRTSVTGPPYADTVPFARALHEAAPTRCVWGSDWPHVAAWDGPPRTTTLLDLMAEWVPDEARRKQVFVDNPRHLYGFG